MTVGEDVLRIWMAKAREYLCRYWGHPDFDDIVAAAYLTMWEAIMNAPEDSVRDLQGYAMRAAWNGAQAYLSSPANIHRTFDIFHRRAVVPALYWDDVRAGRSPEWAPRGLVEPDFVPPLIDRLAMIEELARVKPSRRAVLILCCLEGLTREEARQRLGWSRTKVDKALAGVPFAAIPYAHPGPVRAASHCPHCGQAKEGDNVTLEGRCRGCRNAGQRERWHAARARAG